MRIFKRGKKWYVDYAINGRRVRKSVGSKKTAEAVLDDVKARIARRDFFDVPINADISLRDFIEGYLEHSHTANTEEYYVRKVGITKLLLGVWGDLRVREITTEMISRYVITRSKVVAPATVNQELAVIKNLLALSLDWNYIKSNPAARVKKLHTPPPRDRWATMEELERLIAVAPRDLGVMIAIAGYGGLRRGEIFNLTWGHIDFEAGYISVVNSKNHESRRVPICDRLLEQFRQYRPANAEGYAFPGVNGGRRSSIEKAFRTACRKAGMEDFRFHDLRHTFASHLAMRAVDPQTIARLLGHKTLSMVRRYSHYSDSHLKEAVQKLAQKRHSDASEDDDGNGTS